MHAGNYFMHAPVRWKQIVFFDSKCVLTLHSSPRVLFSHTFWGKAGLKYIIQRPHFSEDLVVHSLSLEREALIKYVNGSIAYWGYFKIFSESLSKMLMHRRILLTWSQQYILVWLSNIKSVEVFIFCFNMWFLW